MKSIIAISALLGLSYAESGMKVPKFLAELQTEERKVNVDYYWSTGVKGVTLTDEFENFFTQNEDGSFNFVDESGT